MGIHTQKNSGHLQFWGDIIKLEVNSDIKLTPVAEEGLEWRPLLGGEGSIEFVGGAVDGHFAKIEGLPLVDGTGYVGLVISIRFFWPPIGFDWQSYQIKL